MGSDKTQVNSMHHQALGEIAPSLKSVAHEPDGVVEAVEGIDRQQPMILGVQWHREEMAIENKIMLNIFKKFVNECTPE